MGSAMDSAIFQDGSMTLQSFDVSRGAPKPLIGMAPTQPGKYPVVVFFHGFLLHNNYYRQLLFHVSSHGIIVVAPQLYIWPFESPETEAQNAEKVVEWLAEGLSNHLPAQVSADLTNVVVAGHSRGGKTAFQVMLNRQAEGEKALAGTASSSSEKLVEIVGVIGLDPVDTCDGPFAKAREKHSLNLGAPAAAIGMQLSEEGGIFSWAPKGRNYAQFFWASGPPVYEMLVQDYGHMDVLDDKLPDIMGRFAASLCKSGPSRGPPRRFAGGCVVAFVLNGQPVFGSLVADPSSFGPPVKVGTHQSFVVVGRGSSANVDVEEAKEKVKVTVSGSGSGSGSGSVALDGLLSLGTS